MSQSAVINDVHLSVIVPVWNGADQLSTAMDELLDFIQTREYGVELILANDGSGVEAARLLHEFAAANPATVVLRNLPHRGKGSAIAAAMQSARGQFRVFIDSDLAYSVVEIEKVLHELEQGSDVVIACRVHPDSRYVMSPRFFRYMYTRHLMSRVLNGAVRALLLPGLLDTQAGLKGFTARAAELVFPQITIPGFGFDLECLYIAHANRLRITQIPVLFRYDHEVSSFRFLKDGVTILTDILRVRSRGWLGAYTVPEYTAPSETTPANAIPAAER
jgi:dolichyl-phosphate beta-glucosyltransferase